MKNENLNFWNEKCSAKFDAVVKNYRFNQIGITEKKFAPFINSGVRERIYEVISQTLFSLNLSAKRSIQQLSLAAKPEFEMHFSYQILFFLIFQTRFLIPI